MRNHVSSVPLNTIHTGENHPSHPIFGLAWPGLGIVTARSFSSFLLSSLLLGDTQVYAP